MMMTINTPLQLLASISWSYFKIPFIKKLKPTLCTNLFDSIHANVFNLICFPACYFYCYFYYKTFYTFLYTLYFYT